MRSIILSILAISIFSGCAVPIQKKFIKPNVDDTKTSAGLKIRAALHTKQYQKGIRIGDSQMKKISLNHYTQRLNWNSSVSPVKNVH